MRKNLFRYITFFSMFALNKAPMNTEFGEFAEIRRAFLEGLTPALAQKYIATEQSILDAHYANMQIFIQTHIKPDPEEIKSDLKRQIKLAAQLFIYLVEEIYLRKKCMELKCSKASKSSKEAQEVNKTEGMIGYFVKELKKNALHYQKNLGDDQQLKLVFDKYVNDAALLYALSKLDEKFLCPEHTTNEVYQSCELSLKDLCLAVIKVAQKYIIPDENKRLMLRSINALIDSSIQSLAENFWYAITTTLDTCGCAKKDSYVEQLISNNQDQILAYLLPVPDKVSCPHEERSNPKAWLLENLTSKVTGSQSTTLAGESTRVSVFPSDSTNQLLTTELQDNKPRFISEKKSIQYKGKGKGKISKGSDRYVGEQKSGHYKGISKGKGYNSIVNLNNPDII